MKSMLLAFLTALLVVLSATGGYFFYQYKINPAREITGSVSALSIKNKDPFSQSSKFVGQVRPEFSLPDVNGTVRHVSEWDGQVLALNFWATWCPPCLKEIPEFVELQHEYADKGLQFIGIALQQAEDVRDFINEHGMNYPVLTGELEVIKIAESYGNEIGALPYTVIIARDGKIAFVKPGKLSGQLAEEVINSLL